MTRERRVRSANALERVGRLLLLVLLAAFAVPLGWALWSLRDAESDGLGAAALSRIGETGVESPVTAVLMSFRAYDTLLELTVLLAAYSGIRVGRVPFRLGAARVPVVLELLNQLLVPFLAIFAAYLLWAGSHASGGAFQAGAVLGAAGVLLALSGGAPRVAPWVARVSIVLGPAVFAAIGLLTLAAGGRLLQYPFPYAKPLILIIEAAAMWSIGATLLVLLVGGVAQSNEGFTSRGRR